MADRNNRLIFSDFFASSSNLIPSASIVNTTAQLEPGEIIHESNTSRAKINLSNVTQSYNSSSYVGNFIPMDSTVELRGFEFPRPYQIFSLRNPKKLYYFDPEDTSSVDDNNNIIVTSGSRRYIAYRPEAGLEAPFYVSGSLTVSGSILSPNNIKYWGAVGDGLADDTLAIQNCVNYISESGGGTVFIPEADVYYKTTYPIELKYKTIVEGKGERSHIYNFSTRSTAEGIAFTSRPFTMGTMNQTFYVRVSRSAFLPISASDDFIRFVNTAELDYYKIGEPILVRNGSGQIGTGSFAGSEFAELRRIVSKSNDRLFVDRPFLINVDPISASETVNLPTGSLPWQQYVAGPAYSFVTNMTPGYLGRDDFSASLFIADSVGWKNIKVSSLSGSGMGDGAIYEPLFENCIIEDCNQGIVVNGYAYGTLRNIKGRKFAGRALESAEGCHDNVFEDLDFNRGGRPEVVANENSATDTLIALRYRDKLINSKFYSVINSASINSQQGFPNDRVLPIAGLVIMDDGSSIINCKIGGVLSGGSSLIVRGSEVSVKDNTFEVYNDPILFPGIKNAQAIQIPPTLGKLKNIQIHDNIFRGSPDETSVRLVYVFDDLTETPPVFHENVSIQGNVFEVKDPQVNRVFLEASGSVFANNIISSSSPIILGGDTLLYSPAIYNNNYLTDGRFLSTNDTPVLFKDGSLVISSPNGTPYKITVTDDGFLSITGSAL